MDNMGFCAVWINASLWLEVAVKQRNVSDPVNHKGYFPSCLSWSQRSSTFTYTRGIPYLGLLAVALEVAPIAVLRVHLQSYDSMVLLLPVPLLDWFIVPSPNAI